MFNIDSFSSQLREIFKAIYKEVPLVAQYGRNTRRMMAFPKPFIGTGSQLTGHKKGTNKTQIFYLFDPSSAFISEKETFEKILEVIDDCENSEDVFQSLAAVLQNGISTSEFENKHHRYSLPVDAETHKSDGATFTEALQCIFCHYHNLRFSFNHRPESRIILFTSDLSKVDTLLQELPQLEYRFETEHLYVVTDSTAECALPESNIIRLEEKEE